MYKDIAFFFLAFATCTSCTRQKPLSREELKSKLQSAASIAAEASTFIDYVGQERSTRHYADGHIEYLSSAVSDINKDLHEAMPPGGAETELMDGRKAVQSLAAELNQLELDIDRPNARAHDQARIATIRRELQRAGSSL